MGCSSPDFLLDPLETPKQIKTKLGRSFCEPQNLQGNVAMIIAKQLVFPLLSGSSLNISRNEDNGGDLSVKTYEELEYEFLVGSKKDYPLHPGDLKNAVVTFINKINITVGIKHCNPVQHKEIRCQIYTMSDEDRHEVSQPDRAASIWYKLRANEK
ncbi:unnamed protein product [Strongylus vulgaris]|uniref:Uncharacterized protein n=1 Tax=Strongylus vulgaris TaxID=40348 RepID=A0A3P7JFU1_STRVU|nr:unnamed protein product [Strongylus vulgaris]VDM79613.1 unnamed protein product [Strongylus vulgaris]